MYTSHLTLFAAISVACCAWDDTTSRKEFATFIAGHADRTRVPYHGASFSFLMDIGEESTFLQRVHATGKLSFRGYVLIADTEFIKQGKIFRRRKTVDGANSKYVFVLQDKGDGSFAMEDLRMGAPDNLLLQLHAPIGDPMAGMLFAEMPSSERVTFVSWTEGAFLGEPCMVLNAIVLFIQGGSTTPVNATYYFSPQHGVCLGAQLRNAVQHTEPYVEEQNIYSHDGGFPALKRRVRYSCSDSAPAKKKVQLSIDVHSLEQNASIEEHAFTLSAFGHEEPHGVTWPKPTPYWLYGTLLAVAAIFIGIVLVRWSLKPKAA